MAKIFDYITNKGSLYSETGVLGVVTGSLLHTKCSKGLYLPCTGSKYITFTLPSLQQKAIITVTKVNNNYVVTQTNTTTTITSLVLNNANYLRYVIYDTVASATSDLKNIQSWVNTLQPLTYQKRLLQLPKPTELKQQGLIAAYNMKPVGNVLHDISGNGKNITVPIGGYIGTTKGLMSVNKNASGTTNNLTASSVTATDFTYCLSHDGMIFQTGATIFKKVKYIGYGATNLQYFEGSLQNFTPNIPIALLNKNGTVIFIYNNSSKLLSVYINGVLSGTATFATAIGNGSFDAIFNASDIGGKQINGVIKDIRIYNRVLTSQEIKAYHNQFNEIILQESFNDMAVGSSKLPNGWVKNGGSFICGENTTNDPIIKSIRKGTKYLKCNTNGIVAIPCKQAYGTWEFDWYKGGDNNITAIGVISDSIKDFASLAGYTVQLHNNETVYLVRRPSPLTTLLLGTIPSYITNNIWYRIRITRSTSGVFTIYILGGNFTNWTLVSTTGGIGTNPVTDNTYISSNYFVMDIDANDRITNINIQNQIKQ